jgi:protein-tyrosine phosphatase
VAEGIMRQKILSRNMDWSVASRGTNKWHKGDPADPRTIRASAKFGINISAHIARRFTTSEFDAYDLIICMADDVLEEMKEFVTSDSQLEKVIVKNFNDPYYGGQDGFEAVHKEIDAYCECLIESVSSISQLNSFNEESFKSAIETLRSL